MPAMSKPTPPFTLVNTADRRTYWIGGQRQSLIVGARETAGRYALSHSVITVGSGASEHIHGTEAEAFYLLTGRLRFVIDGRETLLDPGGFLHLEPGLPYSFDLVGARPAEVLVLYAPGGLEDFIADAGIADAVDGAAARSVQDVAAMKTHAEAYGLTYIARKTS